MRLPILLARAVAGLSLACGDGPVEEPASVNPTPTAVAKENRTIQLAQGDDFLIPLDIQAGTVVEYGFVADEPVNFEVLDAGDNVIYSVKDVLIETGRVKATRIGRYSLVFHHGSPSSNTKTVNLSFRVVPVRGR